MADRSFLRYRTLSSLTFRYPGGSALLHPRLCAFTRFAGFGELAPDSLLNVPKSLNHYQKCNIDRIH